MQTIHGHFDGKVVVFDAPVNLPPNTKVTVLAPGPDETDASLTEACAAASAPAFAKIWDNPLDAEYDRL